MTDASQEKRTKLIENLRSQMDQQKFERARRAGEAMDLEEAIVFAIGAATPDEPRRGVRFRRVG